MADIHNRLEYAQWRQWEAEEVAAIRQDVYLDWIDLANQTDEGTDSPRLAKYVHYVPLAQVLAVWDIEPHPSALENFVWFWYWEGNQIVSKGLKIHGRPYQAKLLTLLARLHLTQELEKLFFRLEQTGSPVAAVTPVVLQMVEHEIMRKRSAR